MKTSIKYILSLAVLILQFGLLQAQDDPRDKHIGLYIGTTEYSYGNDKSFYTDSLYVYKSNTHNAYLFISDKPEKQSLIDKLEKFQLDEFCIDSSTYGEGCRYAAGKFFELDSIVNTFFITGSTRGYYRFRGRKVQSFTSVSEEKAPQLSLSPNPVQDWLYVDLGTATGAANYSLYDVRGQLVQNGTVLQNPTYPIDLSSLNAGLYFIEIRVNDQRKIGKVLKN